MAGNGSNSSHLAAGQHAEDSALAYLQAQGLRLIERNYRCRLGEIDLIMLDGAGLVFVEVRYRSSDRYGGALESVDARKRVRIVSAASHYLASKRIDRPARFDVVALSPGIGRLAVQWVKDAFQASQT
jgi:putative endonuclease